ncbi:MAG: M43 family zinc metalloprotease [Balneola sp.]
MREVKALSLVILMILLFFIASTSCSTKDGITNPELPVSDQPVPGIDIVTLPIAVHVIHFGEVIGEGTNLSEKRIHRQIEILNEDFRRIKNTRGHNNHPNGADTKIQFALAKQNLKGELSNGINRIFQNSDSVENLGYNQNHFAQYVYWNPEEVINIWVTPLPKEAECLVLGSSSGPETDLPGTEYLSIPGPNDAEGILINWTHFGESEINCHARFGRTLTHEMGHYLGLLHLWGSKECETNDFIEDTPAVEREVFGNNKFSGCDGEEVQIENYMNYTDDVVMNMFTVGQAERMHYVLKNHPGRNSLISSHALETPEF